MTSNITSNTYIHIRAAHLTYRNMEDLHDLNAPPPFKKRKFYRRRTDNEDEVPVETVNPDSTASGPSTGSMSLDQMIVLESRSSVPQRQDDIDTPLSVADLLRQRKALQRRKGGIGFGNTGDTKNIETGNLQQSSTGTDQGKALSKVVTVIDRFAPQTGQVADVDQHM